MKRQILTNNSTYPSNYDTKVKQEFNFAKELEEKVSPATNF